MLAQSTIKTLTNRHQTNETNVWREYFQHLFLSYFYRQPKTDHVFFKGGTALRIIYSSPRFSEDLDFSTDAVVNNKNIEEMIINTLADIQDENVALTLKESYATSGGYLAIINFQNDTVIPLHLEFSRRKGNQTGQLTAIVSDFSPPYTLMALSKNQLVAEKIQALLSRKKPRDFYDLYFILRANLLPAREKAILPKILDILKKEPQKFAKELKFFLPKSHWAVTNDFKTILAREIEIYL